MWWENKKNRRGITPIVATLILIAITVAGAGIVYVAFRNMATSMSKITNFQVQSADVMKAGGVVVASFTVKNTGTVPFDNIEITLYGDNGQDNFSITGEVEPGGTRGVTEVLSPDRYKIGETYVVTFAAKDETGGIIVARTMIVTVLG